MTAVRCSFLGLLILGFSVPAWGEVPASPKAALQAFVDKQELAGAVALVADREKVLALEVVGFADIAAKQAMTPDAIFWIASQTKPITAVGVMMLADEGRIALDEPVEKYLPEFRGQMVIAEKAADRLVLKKPSHPITIRETLSHVTGLPFKSAVEEPTLDGLPLAAAVRSYAMTPLLTEPGTHYLYSNAGINTAARIVEVVTGMSYEDYMQQQLFEPLGMKDTTFWPTADQAERIAKSYKPDASKKNLDEFQIKQLIYPLSQKCGRFPMPAGGLFSTANDTAVLCQMLLNGGKWKGRRYISEESIAEMSRRQTPTTVKENYGLGFSIKADSFGHGGAHATSMEIYPSKGIVTIWMVQHGGFPGEGNKAQGVFKDWAVQRFGK